MTTTPVTVLLADDHPLMRKGLREIIDEQEGMSVVDECVDGEQAALQIAALRPAVAVLDIDMPKKTGLDVAEGILRSNIPTRIIFLTMYQKENMFARAMELGAYGYVLKDSAVTEIIDAINAVASGKRYVSPALSDIMLKPKDAPGDRTSIASLLTPTERRILIMISEQKSTKEIADELFVSPRTVETHRAHMCEKLNLSGNNALLKFALEQKDRI